MSLPFSTMASAQSRRGHAAIGAVIRDMESFLPPDNIDRPEYKHCRTTYGLLTTIYKQAELSDAPGNIYKELQQLENELRRRLNNLNATKGVPAKMIGYLDELKAALAHAMSEGVDARFLTQSMEDILEEKPEARPMPKPECVLMVPDTKYKKVRAELLEANKRIQKLNEENNSLILYIRHLEAERASRVALRSLTMTLNKSTGLYDIPIHHLYGAKPAPRPSFNSMDFAVDSPELPKAKRGPGRPRKDSQKASTPQENIDRKKKTKASESTQDMQKTDNRTPATSTPLIKVTPATASTKNKKRKRKSEAQVPQSRSSDHVVSFVSADMLQNIQSSVNAAREVFSSAPAPVQHDEEPSKKKAKKDKASRNSTDTIDFDLVAKETRHIARQARREKKAKRHSTVNAKTGSPVPIGAAGASPPIFPSPQMTAVPPLQTSSKAVITSSPPRQTAVPLPHNAFSHRANALKAGRIGSRDASFLVAETPESQLPKTPANLPDSPIPFKLTDAIKARGSKKSKRLAETSPPTPVLSEAPSSAPPALDKNHKLQLKPDGRVSLTTSNLLKYTTTTQPLSDEPKPRPRAVSRAASSAGSTTSGGTTPSIKELFARVGKPYSRSGAEIDPFVVPEVKKKVSRETHEEASFKEFTDRFKAAQKAVNFSDELEYLTSFLSWRKSNNSLGPLPCLGIKASGCSTKKENILRLNRVDPKNPGKVVVSTEANQALLEDASQRAQAAESLLAMSVAARIPVPIGRVEGAWKLFCPGYSDTHVDRYGYGQRTLSIFSVAGSQETSSLSFTARLSIPPRSMLFSILPFEVPPHAGFRSTLLKTTEEGYKMEIVFLGNGYALLRVDLRLLLSGKEVKNSAGNNTGIMEFVGVHESAVVWREKEDELEVVGRKLFAKYDGEV
ncbi:hypothetical protein N0V86_004571 [Didymella sp. IMI 355093]|nr:hypothetical protein N0V86_004571 [Didymella sp. IMI 355093]